MFRALAVSLVLIAAPVAALAQTAPAPPAPAPPGVAAPAAAHRFHHHHRPRYFAALRRLNLTPDQRQQIVAYMRQMRATERTNAQQLRRQIEGVLTPDQQAQLRSSLHHARNVSPPPQQ